MKSNVDIGIEEIKPVNNLFHDLLKLNYKLVFLSKYYKY